MQPLDDTGVDLLFAHYVDIYLLVHLTHAKHSQTLDHHTMREKIEMSPIQSGKSAEFANKRWSSAATDLTARGTNHCCPLLGDVRGGLTDLCARLAARRRFVNLTQLRHD